ncbi:starch synthase (maltosyl-transferring) [Neorhizobium huautlense]|uniref:Alpha-1,4-glucan:maltose-1-phosphate maltosyltransferase n=1 Tax=Neorhizobium huautlense TaxID=67774 RepID=A0ABT9PVM7_9HYPH|nr:alpha-1,4-glucan--maltose-1-phosphate maltosyltransferase [Neorhizobium huautlense]MDP9838525.1 starch synthase (maltosyl-transferring) [Neorhizobium huautlense]
MNVYSRFTEPASTLQPARIYYVHPLMLRGISAWREVFEHARALDFDMILTSPLFRRAEGASVFVSDDYEQADPQLELGDRIEDAVGQLVRLAKDSGLSLMMDIVPGRSADTDRIAIAATDPRKSPSLRGSRPVDISAEPDEWRQRLIRLGELGLSGFRCLELQTLAPDAWRSLISGVKRQKPELSFLAWTPGTAFETRRALGGVGFDASFSSLAWWNFQEGWFAEEHEAQSGFGREIAFPEAPFSRRVAHGTDSAEVLERRAERALKLAASLGGGLMVPMGFEYGAATPLDPTYGNSGGLRVLRDRPTFDLSGSIRSANETLKQSGDFERQPLGLIASSHSPAAAIVQGDRGDLRMSDSVRVIVFNRDLRRSAAPPLHAISEAASAFLPLTEVSARGEPLTEDVRLLPGELRIFEGRVSDPILPTAKVEPAAKAALSPRLAIEKVTPAVDDGRFVVKRVVGETVIVEADVFGDGHDPLSAALLWRTADSEDWNEVPMTLVLNDRWRAEFPLKRMGRHEFLVEGWRNPFQIFRYEFTKKHEARLDLRLEIQEGINLVLDAFDNASGNLKTELKVLFDILTAANDEQRIKTLLALETADLMAEADRRPHKVRSTVITLDAERTAAAFASWYQIFPRSQSGDPNRHGTFDDVIARLPAIRAMGFDVLYFPPIHPIGATNRKGKNNTLTPGPDDPGSPYAIGSPDGGHDAIHPQLGTFDDFDRLVGAAAEQGLELALDLAIQASPDHPWLKDHPGWFDWRPDGTIRYAENPPKKYEDIVNVDFYACEAVPSLWIELRDVVQKWVDHGVKLFRVDNPHTKPFPFWEWLIADIRSRHPDVVFLSEAFTKPKVMYRLAKIGFSQSYTYFTWRNAKWELEDYMREITTEAPKDFFRPHFFVNTHDINPDFLQNAPRPAYLIRAALAATLSGLWGVYNGFELCEGRPDAKRKEYADSEKYEIRAWDYDRPGNIKPEITLLNRIRRENPALHSHLGLQLLSANNDNILFFEKSSPGHENVVLVAISLDPHQPQEADIEIPLWTFGRPDHGTLDMEDLITGQSFGWTGKWQHIRLEPDRPFAIWRMR